MMWMDFGVLTLLVLKTPTAFQHFFPSLACLEEGIEDALSPPYLVRFYSCRDREAGESIRGSEFFDATGAVRGQAEGAVLEQF